MHLIVDVAEVHALEMGGKSWEDCHGYGWLEIVRHLAGEQFHQLRQTGWQLRWNWSINAGIFCGLLGKESLAGYLYSMLYKFRNHSRLVHLAGALHGGESLVLVLSENVDYLLDPFSIAITDVAQEARFTEDKVVAGAVGRRTAHHFDKRLDYRFIRHSLISLLVLVCSSGSVPCTVFCSILGTISSSVPYSAGNRFRTNCWAPLYKLPF